jgi:L-asparaginase
MPDKMPRTASAGKEGKPVIENSSFNASLPRVSVGALGGTITMETVAGHSGVVPTLTAESLVASIPELGPVAQISTTTLSKLPGASLSTQDVLTAVDWALAEVASGAAGVVIAQGTDTLEETAYLADLHWNRPEALVFTGAMRPPGQPSADGPANLVAACRVAASEAGRQAGVLVVLNDEIHQARAVRKDHSTALNAFSSPTVGPIGTLSEGRVTVHRQPVIRSTLGRPTWDPYVPVLETFCDDDGATLRVVRDAGAHGVTIAAFGAGHVSAPMAAEIERTARDIPVVVSSRTRAGGTLCNTYGFEGSEMDLTKRGAILSGALDHRKSRILLWSLLAGEVPAHEVRTSFEYIAGSGVHPPGANHGGWVTDG